MLQRLDGARCPAADARRFFDGQVFHEAQVDDLPLFASEDLEREEGVADDR